MWQTLIGPVSNLVGSLVESRVEKARAKNKLEITKAETESEIRKQLATSEVGWEKIMAEASKDSWKDEAWTFAFLIIILMSFISPDHVARGFETLDNTPQWFQIAMFASIAASFGLRGLTKFKK